MNAISSDVVIIGGGIMGTSAAFFLSRRGRSVTLLESGLLGQQASGTNFGNTRRQGRPLDQLPLANRASRIWQNSKQLLGIDIKYIESGHLRVCYRDCPETADAFEQYARDAKQLGLELEVLRGASLHKRFPFLGSSVLAGSYSARDGHALDWSHPPLGELQFLSVRGFMKIPPWLQWKKRVRTFGLPPKTDRFFVLQYYLLLQEPGVIS